MLGSLLLVLCGIVGVLVVVALCPIRLRLTAGSEPQRIRLDLRLLDGMAPAIPLLNLPEQREHSRPVGDASADTKPRPRKRKRWGGQRLDLETGRKLLALLAEVPDAFRLTEVRGDLSFGLGDPAETGATYGMLAPLVYGGSGGERFDLQLTPVFDAPCLSGEAHATVRIKAHRLVGIAVRGAGVLLWRPR